MTSCMKRKRCSCCGSRRSVRNFYRDRGRRDGMTVWCKACYGTYARSAAGRATQARYRHGPAGRAYRQWYSATYRKSEKGKCARTQYLQSPKGRAAVARSQRTYYLKSRKGSPERQAREALHRAIRSKRVTRPRRCARCRKRCVPQGHHYRGYAQRHWLTIKWLCSDCHREDHSLSFGGRPTQRAGRGRASMST